MFPKHPQVQPNKNVSLLERFNHLLNGKSVSKAVVGFT